MPDQIIDTTAEARDVQDSILRQMGPQQRSELAAQWSQFMREAALQGIRDRRPEMHERQVVARFVRQTHGVELPMDTLAEPLKEPGMSQTDFLRWLVAEFAKADVGYMVAGSVASGYHGQPRATFDIDIVIEANEAQIEAFASSVAQRCYISLPAALEAVRRRTMFNVIELQTGIKADLILRNNRPFSEAEFQRKRPAVIDGVETMIATAEDCILSKLEWSKLGQSERQFDDALKVARTIGEELDVAYLKKWAGELDVEDLLERLLREA